MTPTDPGTRQGAREAATGAIARLHELAIADDAREKVRDLPVLELSDRVAQAFALALEHHRTQSRKGTAIPYLAHPMAVASLVAEHGGSEDEIVAALLHDVVEDGGGLQTLDTIESQFGSQVAAFVRACSDDVSGSTPKPPWTQRKSAFLEQLATAPVEVARVVAADKLHNLLSLVADHAHMGPALWGRFKAGRDGTLCYYASVLAVVRAVSETENPPDQGLQRLLAGLGQAVDAAKALA